MKRLSGPLPPSPAVTCSRRKITPFFRARAPDAVLTSGMMSGSVTWSRSWVQPGSGNSATRPNRPKARSTRKRTECRVMGRSSEGDVQAERPVRGRRLGLEVAHDPGRATEVVGLRIDSRELCGPPQVAAGDGEAQAVRAECPRHCGGELVGGRRLAQPQKIRPLDVAVLRGGAALAQRHDRRLLPQRSGRVELRAAVEPRLATDPLGAVQLVEARLGVEQALDADLLVQQIEPGCAGDLPTWIGVTHEHHIRPDRYFVRRDDPVAVGVAEGVGALPPAVDGVTLHLAGSGPDDWWDAAHVGDEIGVVAEIGGDVPAELRAVDHAGTNQALESTVHHRA